MRRALFIFAMVAALAMSTMAAASAQGQSVNGNAANSLGKTTLDTTVGWDVGDGQLDGEFITAEVQGIEIGLRAQERFQGIGLLAGGTNGNRVAVYEAATGDTGGNNATWNYDWHVDVSGGTGSAEGRTLDDYTLTLERDFSNQNIFGLGVGTLELSAGGYGACADAVLTETRCQQSWNPGFGNDDFNPHAAGSYHLRLVLTPETFSGPPLAVSIEVNVAD